MDGKIRDLDGFLRILDLGFSTDKRIIVAFSKDRDRFFSDLGFGSVFRIWTTLVFRIRILFRFSRIGFSLVLFGFGLSDRFSEFGLKTVFRIRISVRFSRIQIFYSSVYQDGFGLFGVSLLFPVFQRSSRLRFLWFQRLFKDFDFLSLLIQRCTRKPPVSKRFPS